MSDAPRLISVADYAAEAGVSVDAVRGWIHSGKLRAVTVGSGSRRRHFRLTRRAIEEFERGEVYQPKPEPARKSKRQREADFVRYY
jgi:excisionase family DNA binding protein